MSNGRGVLQTDAGGVNIRVRLRGEDSGGELAVIEEVLGAEFEGPPLHVHPSFGEGFYVLEGELRRTGISVSREEYEQMRQVLER
jgi:quercetin dioxygenase-like cupin family protein